MGRRAASVWPVVQSAGRGPMLRDSGNCVAIWAPFGLYGAVVFFFNYFTQKVKVTWCNRSLTLNLVKMHLCAKFDANRTIRLRVIQMAPERDRQTDRQLHSDHHNTDKTSLSMTFCGKNTELHVILIWEPIERQFWSSKILPGITGSGKSKIAAWNRKFLYLRF